MRVYFLLLYVYGVTSDKETELEIKRRTVLDQLTKTRTVLQDGYHLVTRHIATDVYKYRSYRTVSVIFYPILRDVVDARFTFQSEELHLNNIGHCSPQDVIINIKRASYPAVNPDGYSFPKDFIDPSTRERIHTLNIQSDGKNTTYSISNPKPGNWYALVYRKWEDPRTQKVEQQGLVADCSTILYTDLQVKREESIDLIDCYIGLTVNAADIPAYYKCMTVYNADPVSLNITVLNATESDNVRFRVQALSLPTEEEYLVSCAFDPKLSNTHTITFHPNLNSWHYIVLDNVHNTSKYADCESYYKSDEIEASNHTVLDLMRDDKGRFFTFDYGLPTADVQDATSLINLTSHEITSVKFKVNQFIDIGGNLAIEASLLMSLKYFMGYRRQLKQGALLGFTEENQFLKVVICMDIEHTSIPLSTGHCKYNDKVKPALFVLNSTDSESIYEKIIIPYPDSGNWYLTLRLFCDEVVCPCRTSHNGTKYYVETNAADKDGENFSGELTNNTREGVKNCNATVVLLITSTSCLSGRCSDRGNCVLNTFGGLVMSFCSCYAGYGGWDCSDNSRMDSKKYMLISILLLTLSNLLFIVSIYVAVIRLYYTEALMYAFTMVFSTFYHACDAPSQVAYCIVRGNILQFGDFYCGLMSFWVTLLAMSIIEEKLRSTLQLIGAIVIALLTTWNMHSIVSFMVPVAVGVVIVLSSWLWNYRKTRCLMYPKSYYCRYLPLGLILVFVGLVCYAFLQTEQNYKIIHSVWHMVVALCVGFLLPDIKRGGHSNAFLPSPNYCRLPFCRLFNRSQAPITPESNQTSSDNPVSNQSTSDMRVTNHTSSENSDTNNKTS